MRPSKVFISLKEGLSYEYELLSENWVPRFIGIHEQLSFKLHTLQLSEQIQEVLENH